MIIIREQMRRGTIALMHSMQARGQGWFRCESSISKIARKNTRKIVKSTVFTVEIGLGKIGGRSYLNGTHDRKKKEDGGGA